MSLKRKSAETPEAVLPEGLEADWQRLGLIMYNDHNSAQFHLASKHIIGSRFIDWYKAARASPEDEDSDANSDGNDDLGVESLNEEGMSLQLQFEDCFKDPDNVLIDPMYKVPYITLKVPFVKPTPHEKIIVLSYANSKRYELQVAAERLSGQIATDPERSKAFEGQMQALVDKSADSLTPQQVSEYKQALLKLRCDKIGAACHGWGPSSLMLHLGEITQPKTRAPMYAVDDKRAFFALIQYENMAPTEQPKWEAFWKSWRGQ